MRTLVVEDDPSYAAIVEWLLRQEDRHEVEVCHTLRDAVGRLAQRAFDAVVLDLDLPDASDLAGLHTIQGCAPGLPVIILTGDADPKTLRNAMYAGAEEFIVKNRDAESTLALRVRNAILRRSRDLHIESRPGVRERDALIREFLNEAAHELRTPLTSIAIAQEMLRHDDLDRVRRDRLRGSLDRLRRGIEDFLGVLPREARPGPLHLPTWAARLDPHLADHLDIKASPVDVMVDEELFRRGIDRLLRVAISEAPRARLQIEERNQQAVVAIRFHTDKHPEASHPVLLSIARRALEGTDGSLSVHTSDGAVCFEVTLPRAVASLI